MIYEKHKTTKRQRRSLFAAACQDALNRAFGASRRKRAIRQMSRMSKEQLEALKARAQGSGSQSPA